MKEKVSVFWFRRDLRLFDNAGLYCALKYSSTPILPVFIFDRIILDDLKNPVDPRVTFIYDRILQLHHELREYGSSLAVYHGTPVDAWRLILDRYDVQSAYTNRDYEPYAKQRDESIAKLLDGRGIPLHTSKDHVIFESQEITKDDGNPYVVFTPYQRKWLTRLTTRTVSASSYYLSSYHTQKYAVNYFKTSPLMIPSLSRLGFKRSMIDFPIREVNQRVVRDYDQTRDYPALNGTTRLGIHFRFGTISIREKARKAREINRVFLSELIWRDFYSQILDRFPHVVSSPFRPKYDQIPWRNADDEFEAWCQGQTGYPLVDAGMRELNETGYMHNRVRMVAASFLTKHLLIDWRKGEAYFAEKLLDYDLASNNGGWQWAAGCGTDAAPYFRIFNPTSQLKKFDPHGAYVRKWITELDSSRYPEPIVDHNFARRRCLETFRAALQD